MLFKIIERVDMDSFFSYRNSELFVEDVPLSRLAAEYGTPLYVYSRGHMLSQYRGLVEAMSRFSPLVCYSVKANSNGTVIKTFLDEGAGLDIVSGGELFRALRAGADASRIVFAGVGKTVKDIEYALGEGILFFTVESEQEAARISECATRLGVTGRVAFRVNPDVDPLTHQYISTGKKENKFGMDPERITRACGMAAGLPNLEIVGIHAHIGSQILSPKPFGEALAKLAGICRKLRADYPSMRYLDIGGGIGISYENGQAPLAPAAFAAEIAPYLDEIGMSVVMEPGRCLVGNAGTLVCNIEYIKESAEKKFVIVDAAMNDLVRPSLYSAFHDIVPLREGQGAMRVDVVGPICESGDFLAKDRDIPAVKAGDKLAVMSAGAYGFSMSSQYNSRPRAAEVMVDGAESFVIRQRETWDDLVARETAV